MAPSPSESTDLASPPPSKITDLNEDSLSHCASYLSLQDISNLAMTCKFLKRVSYSDSIWQRCFRYCFCSSPLLFLVLLFSFQYKDRNRIVLNLYSERWPNEVARISSTSSGVRDAYLARHASMHQFKFVDPLSADLYTNAKPFDHIVLDKNDVIFSQV